MKFLLSRIFFFNQEFENLRIFPFVAPLPAGEGLGERPLHQRAEVMQPAGSHDGAAQEGNTFGRGTGSSGGY